jgi:hypothetical protein
MAPLPESNTARAFLTYRVAEADHTMTVRYDAANATVPEVIASIGDFIAAMDAKVYNSVFVRFELAAEGSNVRIPATWTGTTEWGGGAGPQDDQPYFWSFTGKDLTGRRTRVELFGRIPASNQDWRLAAVDDTSIGAALAALESESADFLSIGGNQPIWNQYANRSVSQHWIKENR